MSNDYTLPPVPDPDIIESSTKLYMHYKIERYGHACAEAGRAPLLDQLGQCFRLSGADPDGNENWRLAPRAVDAVRQLRTDYDEACEENAQLLSRIAGLKKGLTDGTDAMMEIIKASNEEIDRLRAEVETERMRLAACGVIAMANTPESAAQQRKMLPEYWSGSAESVAAAVDREMELRAEVEAKGGEVEALRDHLREHLRAAVACQNSVVETRGADGMDRLSFANDKARALLAQPATPWVNPLAAEVEKLRAALSQCATAVGASAAPDCSVEFLACVPREVELVVGKLTAQLAAERADAERWRFWKPRLICADFEYVLDQQGFSVLVFEIPEGVQVSADVDKTTDAAIDAARAEGGKGVES